MSGYNMDGYIQVSDRIKLFYARYPEGLCVPDSRRSASGCRDGMGTDTGNNELYAWERSNEPRNELLGQSDWLARLGYRRKYCYYG